MQLYTRCAIGLPPGDARAHTHTHTHVRIVMGDAGTNNGAAASQYTSRRTAAVQAADAATMVPINARSTRASKPARRPPPKPKPDALVPVLQARPGLDADEAYGEQEKALSEFLRLHPMLSLNVYAHSNRQLPRARHCTSTPMRMPRMLIGTHTLTTNQTTAHSARASSSPSHATRG